MWDLVPQSAPPDAARAPLGSGNARKNKIKFKVRISTVPNPTQACDNLFDSGNQQERLVDNSNFNSDPSEIQSEGKKYSLGGFAEGEGSVSASVKVHSDFRFGVNVQPEFGVTQHQNGKHILAEFKELFGGKGNLHLKPGTKDVGKVKEFNIFLEILERKQRKEHFTQEGLIDMVKLAYTLNEEGKGKTRKRTLEEVYGFLTSAGKSGLVAGVYLWINRLNGKIYGLAGFVLVIFLVSDPGSVLALEHDETKANMFAAQKGNTNAKGYKQSDEHKAKIAASNYNSGKAVYLYVPRSSSPSRSIPGRREALADPLDRQDAERFNVKPYGDHKISFTTPLYSGNPLNPLIIYDISTGIMGNPKEITCRCSITRGSSRTLSQALRAFSAAEQCSCSLWNANLKLTIMSASIILSDSTGTPAYRGGGTWKLRSYQGPGTARIWKSKAEKRECGLAPARRECDQLTYEHNVENTHQDVHLLSLR
ncbi:12102_t:CDS:10 [Acaulospora colombiana]|uniref:12102_t:CDS:1 n=1 Tax=Acaulospora colombiana TaxID=27376 RepID=A0ACA9M9B4_9GLOM|nr:12102_t:CDS:10 [Acaulospora colombiana]